MIAKSKLSIPALYNSRRFSRSSFAPGHPHAQGVQELGGLRPAGRLQGHHAHRNDGDLPPVRHTTSARQAQRLQVMCSSMLCIYTVFVNEVIYIWSPREIGVCRVSSYFLGDFRG